MIPTGFALLMIIPIFLLGYAFGSIVELRRSQEEIDTLSKLISAHTEEQLKVEDYKGGS